jgi:DMSO/TMAO reductase YedYZ molybdopterin-dependent catalytic subunit
MRETVSLSIRGSVESPCSYDFDGLAALAGQVPDVSQLAEGREGGAVTLAAILASARPTHDARFITIEAEGDYSASVPLDAVRNQAVLIYRLGEEPLPSDNGGPVRFFIPDVAACQTDEIDQCANVKYVHSIVLSAERGQDTRPQSLRQHVGLHLEDQR